LIFGTDCNWENTAAVTQKVDQESETLLLAKYSWLGRDGV
jgi:hypothetical protein